MSNNRDYSTSEESTDIKSLDYHDYHLFVLLLTTCDVVSRVRQYELDQYNIKIRQIAVLVVTKYLESHQEEITPGNIAKLLFREPHTVSKILTRMEKDGLVRKRRNPKSKNKVNIILTEKGEQVYKQSLNRNSIRNMMSCLSIIERQQLYSILEKVRDKATSSFNEERNNHSFSFDILQDLV